MSIPPLPSPPAAAITQPEMSVDAEVPQAVSGKKKRKRAKRTTTQRAAAHESRAEMWNDIDSGRMDYIKLIRQTAAKHNRYSHIFNCTEQALTKYTVVGRRHGLQRKCTLAAGYLLRPSAHQTSSMRSYLTKLMPRNFVSAFMIPCLCFDTDMISLAEGSPLAGQDAMPGLAKAAASGREWQSLLDEEKEWILKGMKDRKDAKSKEQKPVQLNAVIECFSSSLDTDVSVSCHPFDLFTDCQQRSTPFPVTPGRTPSMVVFVASLPTPSPLGSLRHLKSNKPSACCSSSRFKA